MNSLATNTYISQKLKKKYYFALAFLPTVSLFSAFYPTFIVAGWLSKALDIPAGAPVRMQPNGLLWLLLFLVGMAILMIAGYFLGWIVNALMCRIFLGWSKQELRDVFLQSKVPTNWLKEAQPTKLGPRNWEKIRAKGKWHFVLTRGVIGYGLPMFIIMTFAKPKPEAYFHLWHVAVWAIAGGLFGLLTWHFSEKSYQKRNSKK